MRRWSRSSFIVLWPLALVAVAACGSNDSSSGRPTVVATTAILGAVVSDAVGDAADVVVLVPNGVDPHDWEPSAKDVEAINGADLVVANGLGLEEKLVETLESAEKDGVRVFRATDHIDALDGDPHGRLVEARRAPLGPPDLHDQDRMAACGQFGAAVGEGENEGAIQPQRRQGMTAVVDRRAVAKHRRDMAADGIGDLPCHPAAAGHDRHRGRGECFEHDAGAP